ncbi:MAG TPA: substrate-binding domain-containing protein [Solirubrobacterales bacterium]|nr:substrate-binding domain-containing protein [Solirubrobacterales bacterium]
MPDFIGRGVPRGQRRGVLLVGVVLLVLVAGALNAASAAALGEQCSGSDTKGLGAFLQTEAQERWSSPKIEGGFNTSPSSLACNGGQGSGGTPAINYVPLGSPAALRHWGAEDGILHVKEFGFLAGFLGTDIAPAGPVGEEGTTLSNMKAALGSDVIVVPVTQTAIAIAAHPPTLPAHSPCVVPQINVGQLQRVFSGQIKNWRQLGAASDTTIGGDCDQAITRIVRDESAGTTYQFKHYLNSINPGPLPCTGKSQRTWQQLQEPFGGESPPNVEWPQNVDCQKGEGHVTTVAGPGAEGESGPLSYVGENPGTITYGSLPEAEQWAPKQIINVYNSVKFADPATKAGEANCGAAKYTLPAGAESGINVDWSQVYGSNPKAGKVSKDAYPICTLTWDIAAVGHFGKGVATTVHDYLSFVVDKEGGQAAVKNAGYQTLPSSVTEAAVTAISHIEGEEEGGGEEKEGSGTGTTLCKSEPALKEGVLICPPGEGFSGLVTGQVTPKAVTTFESSSGPEASVSCTQGHFLGEFNEDGTGIFGGISGFGYGAEERCTSTFPGEPLTVVAFDNPPYYASRFVYTNPLEPQGFFQLRREDKAPPLLKFILGKESSTCIYEPIALNSTVSNGSPTEMLMSGKWKLLEDSAGGVCPTVMTSLSLLRMTRTSKELPLYISGSEGASEEEEKEGGGEEEKGGTSTVLCKATPELEEGVLVCPSGKGFSGGVAGAVVPKTVVTFESVSGHEGLITCPEGHYVGEFNEDGTSAGSGITAFEFGLKEGCTTNFPEEPEAIVSFEGGPFDTSQFAYTNPLEPQGAFTLASSKKGAMRLTVHSNPECVYVPNFVKAKVANGIPTQMTMDGLFKLREGDSKVCPAGLAQTGLLTVTRAIDGEPIYIAGK